jgi:hypothetical protein
MRKLLVAPALLAAALAGAATRIITDQCGPFTDVSPQLCPYVLEMYYLGITAGTSATTYSPNATVTRGQAAVFVSKGVNQALARSSRRAALGQWWTTTDASATGRTALPGSSTGPCVSDGTDVWVSSYPDGNVSRVRASDGRLLGTWTGAPFSWALLSAMGRIFVSGNDTPGRVYMIDPASDPGAAVLIADKLGDNSIALAFDGSRLWAAGFHSVSILTPAPTAPWAVTTVTDGFATPASMIFDGSSIWVADDTNGLLRVDATGHVTQTVPVGTAPHGMTFDGANLWVPNTGDDSISVVRVDIGAVIATLTGNGVAEPVATAFDGQRMLVVNANDGSVSLFRAADLAPLGVVHNLAGGVCSDGLNFWLPTVQNGAPVLQRF